MIGATARDLSLHYAYGLDVPRATEDVDFSVMVRDWDAFTSLRACLIGSGAFAERGGVAIHKLRHVGTKLPIDVVPFGGIERPDRTVAWPPEHAESSIASDCARLWRHPPWRSCREGPQCACPRSARSQR